jgi:F0F1-type ATP synthase membrane subunit b/b'
MTIRMPIDVATRVSTELSRIIEVLANDPDREEPATLDEVRAMVEEGDSSAAELELMHPQEKTSALAELDSLIEEFGGEMLAGDFVINKASEGLSRIIETAMSDLSMHRRPTLAMVRESMAEGLTARLVGDGTLDPDDEGSLLSEIDGLIDRFGADTMAEDFVRFE